MPRTILTMLLALVLLAGCASQGKKMTRVPPEPSPWDAAIEDWQQREAAGE